MKHATYSVVASEPRAAITARTETYNSALAAIDARYARKLGTKARTIGQVRRLMASAKFETTSSIPWELSLIKILSRKLKRVVDRIKIR